jgi:hypothetical protein
MISPGSSILLSEQGEATLPDKYRISKDVLALLSPLHKIVAECLIRKGEWILVDDVGVGV